MFCRSCWLLVSITKLCLTTGGQQVQMNFTEQHRLMEIMWRILKNINEVCMSYGNSIKSKHIANVILKLRSFNLNQFATPY